MKHFIVIISFLITGFINCQAEGIDFFHGSWQEVLNKAKSEKKPVFIDIYTSWCGPCKKMVNEVFPLTAVGDRFNTSFINFKIDAEKGEGIEVAKKYKVNAYPTYLFINGDGTLIYRCSGSMPAEKFITEATIALGEFNDPKPFATWQEEYESKKNDKDFLWEYLQKRMKLKINSADVLDQYFSVCTSDEILQSEFLPNLTQFQNMNIDGPCFTYLFQNRNKLKELLKEKYKKIIYVDEFLVYVANQDVNRAIEKRDELLLHKIIEILLASKPDDNPLEWRSGVARMKFYTDTNQPGKLLGVTRDYGRSVLKFNTNILFKKDSIALSKFEKDLAEGKITVKPENLVAMRKLKGSANSVSYAYRVRDLANSVFKIIDKKKTLKQALAWIDYAEKFSDNFTITELKAGLLYKSGKPAQAIELQKKAIVKFENASQNDNLPLSEKIKSRLNENLAKMTKGKPTWQNNNVMN